MATWPTPKVELALGSDPYDTTPTWVDVTAYVRDDPGVMVSRGNVGQLGAPVTTGTCSFLLDNRTRRFDPSYAAGPYFGQLKARCQVRVTATWAAVDYVIFRGFITGPQVVGTDGGKDSVVQIVAYDALSILARTLLSTGADGPTGVYITALTPTLWLRSLTASSWTDVGSGARTCTPAYLQSFIVGDTLAVGLTNSQSWVSSYGNTVGTLSSTLTATGNWSVQFWMTSTMDSAVTRHISSTTSTANMLGITAAGVLSWVTSTTDANRTSVVGSLVVNDGNVHHVVITCSGGTSFAMYVDGVADPSLTITTAGTGNDDFAVLSVGAGVTSTTIQDYAVFPSALTAVNALAMYGRGLGQIVQSSADRVTFLLDEAGFPSAWRDITTEAVAEVAELVYTGQSVLAALQQVERSEQGRMFVSADGLLTFLYRWAAYVAAVSITVSDDGAGEHYGGTLAISQTDDDMINDLTVTSRAGAIRYTDSASVTADGSYSDSVDTILSDQAQLSSMAFGLVNERSTQTTRIDPMDLRYPNSWPTVLALELHQKMIVEHTPLGVGAQSSYETAITQLTYRMSTGLGWQITVAGAPLPAVDYWVLDVSTLGTDTTPGY